MRGSIWQSIFYFFFQPALAVRCKFRPQPTTPPTYTSIQPTLPDLVLHGSVDLAKARLRSETVWRPLWIHGRRNAAPRLPLRRAT
jgi:hypothetical protein